MTGMQALKALGEGKEILNGYGIRHKIHRGGLRLFTEDGLWRVCHMRIPAILRYEDWNPANQEKGDSEDNRNLLEDLKAFLHEWENG